MSHEVEALSNIPINAQSITEMREEKVLNPYQPRPTRPLATPPPVGQADMGRGTEEAAKPSEETVKLSPQIAALARKEQKFRQQLAELEKQKAVVAAEKSEIAELRAMRDKLAAKDYSGLEGLVDYNDYSQYQVNKLNGMDPVQEEFKKLNGKISEIEKSAQENVSKQFEAAVNERRTAAAQLIEKTDQFPKLKKAKATEAVVKHILDTWEHDSEELSVEQAAKEVEEGIIERAKQWASLLEEEKEGELLEEGKAKLLPPMKAAVKTLTNQVTAGELKRPQKSYQGMNDQDRWAEARRRAEEKLQTGR